jgi:hypothetical protein
MVYSYLPAFLIQNSHTTGPQKMNGLSNRQSGSLRLSRLPSANSTSSAVMARASGRIRMANDE